MKTFIFSSLKCCSCSICEKKNNHFFFVSSFIDQNVSKYSQDAFTWKKYDPRVRFILLSSPGLHEKCTLWDQLFNIIVRIALETSSARLKKKLVGSSSLGKDT